MTKATHHKTILTVNIITGITLTLAIAALVLATSRPCTKTTLELTKAPLTNTIFTHKDTGMQMTFFGSNNDYYYLKSINDYNWVWTGTHQDFITQFWLTEPLPEPKETSP